MSNMSKEKDFHAKVAAAQATIYAQGVKKDGKNPHFRSTYATLAGVLGVVGPAVAAEGLVLTSSSEVVGAGLEIRYLITDGDKSITAVCTMPLAQNANAQAIGSAISYGRRYSLMALLSLSAEDDDDGNAASAAAPKASAAAPKASAPAPAASSPEKGWFELDDSAKARVQASVKDAKTFISDLRVAGYGVSKKVAEEIKALKA